MTTTDTKYRIPTAPAIDAQRILQDVIAYVRARIERVALSTAVNEAVDDYIDRNATAADCVAILNEIGDVDLSDPRPDLSEGWPRVLRQLASNALYVKVSAETAGWPSAEDA